MMLEIECQPAYCNCVSVASRPSSVPLVRLEACDRSSGADLPPAGRPVEWRSKAPLLGGGEDDFFATLQAKKYRSSLLTGRSRVASCREGGLAFGAELSRCIA